MMSQLRLWRAGVTDPSYNDRRIGRKPFAAGKINRQTYQHADASSAEAVTPAVHFAERAGDERRDNDAGINEAVVNLKGVGATVIACRVERADLAREVSLETPNADEKRRQRNEEGNVEGNQELAGRHE